MYEVRIVNTLRVYCLQNKINKLKRTLRSHRQTYSSHCFPLNAYYFIVCCIVDTVEIDGAIRPQQSDRTNMQNIRTKDNFRSRTNEHIARSC